ncbi:MAG: methionine synthase [Dehalobacter sp.]|nr:methionine synthase [Dehalobacter sp.]
MQRSGETMKQQIFNELLAKKILILDGAMGTMLQQKDLSAEDFGGPEQEGCNEILTLTRPYIVRDIHEAYLKAGADIIETNTFGGTNIVLGEYHLGDRDMEINEAAARLAREAADKWSTAEKPRFVAGSMGPTTKMLAFGGGITFTDLEEAYCRQTLGLIKGGVDLLIVETCQDTLNIKAAGLGIQRAFAELGREVPLVVSVTIEPSGTMLAGQNIEALYISIQHLKPAAVGMNCGTGAELMNDHLRTLEGLASCAVSCYPNAGLPDEEGGYQETPEEFAGKMAAYAAKGWLNIAGGCCGTTDRHIEALAAALAKYAPRQMRAAERSSVAGLEAVWPEEENRPLLVGERANVIGSRKFKELIAGEYYEEGSEIARNQVKKGAQIVDVCVANPDRDELEDMVSFLPHVVNKVKAPLMLDTTDPAVLEAGLRLIQGKAIINSINLENGRERFDEVVPLLRKFGTAVVVGLIDEQGMALTRERKLEVAGRSYDLLVHEYGLSAADIIFDPLTFPVGTGDVKYLGSAVETIEGLRLIKAKYPECKTILGISNVSFGLPAAGREVLNAVFVYLNTVAGLDYAIVNSEKLERYATIPQAEKKLAQDLLLNTNDQTLKAFTDFYREKKVTEQKQTSGLSVEERLAGAIVEGSKEGLENDLYEALTKYRPLEIINGPLMKGMEEVGSLFNRNQLIVAEVLQSAEVMKAAVTILEAYMEKAEEAVKGKILLATVKGDVHDIGKNLVEIILANNGYKVVNLGVKVSSEQLIEAARREMPDAIGLSGLLVKSVQQMLLTAQDLQAAGINIPLILGGAALSRKYTEEKIAPQYGGPVLYARDAMAGLNLLNGLKSKTANDSGSYNAAKNNDQAGNVGTISGNIPDSISGSISDNHSENKFSPVSFDGPVCRPQHTAREVLLDYPLAEIIPNLDLPFILRRYLGVKNKLRHPSQEEIKAAESLLLDSEDVSQDKSAKIQKFVQDFLEEIQEHKLITVNGVFAFYPACANGNTVAIMDSESDSNPDSNLKASNIVLEELSFPRQQKDNGLCLADYVRPWNKLDGQEQTYDYLGMFALTTGLGIREKAENYRDKGEYLKSFLLQVLALELAEGFADIMHEKMRKIWGIDNGIRVSPGYPIYPALEEQAKLFRLLKPEEIGITLTENFMMDPEASVTAVVFSHPEAKIFNINR